MFGCFFSLCQQFKTILLEASFDSRSLSYIFLLGLLGKGKNRIIINIIFILFVCTSWNGLNFAFLTSLVYWHKVHRFVLLNLHCRCFRSQSAHLSRKLKKKRNIKGLANPFYFSLIWETIFCMSINTMAGFWLVQKCAAIWREKQNVRCLLYLYISVFIEICHTNNSINN